MHDFGGLVYLDLHKTGSNYVSAFLRASCTLREVKNEKHKPITSDYRSDSFYFITVRHPLQAYASLFRYGMGGKGFVRHWLGRAGHNALYGEGPGAFAQWLSFVLDSQNAASLGADYAAFVGVPDVKHGQNPAGKGKYAAQRSGNGTAPHDRLATSTDSYSGPPRDDIGLMSFRFLTLTLAFPMRSLSRLAAQPDFDAAVRREAIDDLVIRQEKLEAGLFALASDVRPDLFDLGAANRFLAKGNRINASSPHPVNLDLPRDLLKVLRHKERLLFAFYPVDEA